MGKSGVKTMRYKFRYFNGIYKTVATFAGPFRNFFILVALSFLSYFLIGKFAALIGIEDYLINDTVWNILRKIILICSALWSIIYCVLKKGVFLYDNHLVIARYTITLTNWKNRISINYDDIESVNVNYTDLHFTKYRFLQIVPGGDESYNIELTLKNGKKYFFSIEDQEEFCQNLNLLIDKSKNI